ncbi:MAG: hypothetical protein FWD14_02095 [Treponema sp.]|nr:hypothetical protein [Treponema sp.]
MFKSFGLRILLLLIVLALLPLGSVFGNSYSWSVLGSIFHFAANNGVDSDPAPILPSAGFSFSLQLMRFLRVEFTEDIYFTNYEYNSKLGYPMACNPENRSAFVMGFLTGAQLTGYLPLGRSALRIYGGPAADLRLVVLAFGLNHPADFTGNIETDAQMQTDAILKYFWEKGRWFMPVAGAGFDFPLNEKYLLGFDFRVWFPVYKLWTNDNVPAVDGWRFGAGLRITPR